MTPATSSWSDPALRVGTAFVDAAGGVALTPVWADASGAGVDVSLSGGGCVRVDPAVSLAPAEGQGLAGEPVSYTVSITNRDSNCPSTLFTTLATPPLGWIADWSLPALTIAPGATRATVLTVSSPDSAPPGTYAVGVAVVNTALPTHDVFSTVSYTITLAGLGAFSDDFARTDAATLGSDWEAAGGSLFIADGEARSAATATMHRAVQADLLGTTQDVQATFAAVETFGGPRLGLLLRYRDERNYYACYRQTGGTSRIRIVRVTNGTEHVLASASVKNPPKGHFFTLACRADGSTLSATLDGGKTIVADDDVLHSGQVGVLMGYFKKVKTPYSHRLDDFAAFVQ
jgi:hypothetical protein